MSEGETEAILPALIIDTFIFAGLFTGFIFYRKLRSPVIHLDEDIPMKKPYLHEGEYEFMPLFKKINQMSLDSLHLAIGEWGYVYLTLQKYIIFTLLAYSVVALPILIVVYMLGDSEVDDETSKYGISHVISDNNTLIAPILFIFAFSLALSMLVYSYYEAASKDKSEEFVQSQKYVVKITKVPREYPPEFINYRLLKLLKSRYSKDIISVYTIPAYESAYKKYLKIDELHENIKQYEYKIRTKNKRPTIMNESFQKVDAVEFTEAKIARTKEKLLKEKERGLYKNAGKSFVFCKTEKKVKQIIELRLGNDDIIDTSLLRFKAASNSEDIIWKNVGHKSTYSTISRVLYNALFIFLFLIILTPSTFNSIIISTIESLNGGTLLQSIVGVYLPSLLLLVYQQVILPEVVEYLVSKEKHSYRHDEISSGLRKYLFYLIFYIFLYPLLGLRFIEFISVFFSNDEDWEHEFADKINESGYFFTIFLLHECFLKNGFDLLVTGKYFKAKAKALIATTDVERALAYQAEDFRFDFEFAVSLNIFVIVCSFGVVYPLVLVPGLGFFILRYFVHKHNLLAVFYANRNSSAYPVLFSVLCGIAVSIFAMQVLTGATFILSDGDNYQFIAKLIVPAACCELVLCILYFNILVKKGKIERLKEYDRLLEFDIKEYYHPIDKTEVI